MTVLDGLKKQETYHVHLKGKYEMNSVKEKLPRGYSDFFCLKGLPILLVLAL